MAFTIIIDKLRMSILLEIYKTNLLVHTETNAYCQVFMLIVPLKDMYLYFG